MAEALAGVRSPGGKLPVTYPRSSGQIPTFYGHKASGGRSHWKVEYVDLSNEPMYPFGHGLTYSRFTVGVDATAFSWATVGDVVDVVATVTNVGPSPADEVVQLYTRDPIASITRPVLELQGFARVGLAPGRSARVTFHLHVASLGFSGPDMTYVVEPGEIELLVGTSSAALQPAGRIVVTGEERDRHDAGLRDTRHDRLPLTRRRTVLSVRRSELGGGIRHASLAPWDDAVEFDLQGEAQERAHQHDDGQHRRALDRWVDRDRLDDVGDDQDFEPQQDRSTDVTASPLVRRPLVLR